MNLESPHNFMLKNNDCQIQLQLQLYTLSNFEVRRDVSAYLRQVLTKLSCTTRVLMESQQNFSMLGLLAVRYAIFRG